VFVHYSVAGDAVSAARLTLEALETAGHPVYRIDLPEPEALGGEFLRWEIATATAGAILGVNPFDEPDVAAAKRATADLLEHRASEGGFPAAVTLAFEGGVEVLASEPGDASTVDGASVAEALARWLDLRAEGGYVATLGYFDSGPERDAAVARLRERLGARTGLATTFGYGPRYLHSTGQLHKGGPEGGIYLVLTADPVEDLALEEGGFTLGTLLRAQALGDVRTLRERGRHVLHAHLGWDVESGLETLARLLDTPL
jgi:transaldolase/glucose-6-phosphate isomerase